MYAFRAVPLSGIILIVDDHVTLAENLAEILTDQGYVTEVADSADGALARIDRGGIGALITDYKMPGRSGAELIAELRRSGRDIPAIVMSAYSDSGTRDVCEDAGAFDVLGKPVGLARLIEAVRELGNDLDILVVDDDPDLAQNMAEIMRTHGLDAVGATSVEQALSHRRRLRAAIVDFRLPDGDGVQLGRRLRARTPGVELLLVSGYGPELRARLGEPPSTPYAEKPVDIERLTAWVKRVAGDPGAGTATSPS